MMAILYALNKWCPYLIGRHLKVKIDHDSISIIKPDWIIESRDEWKNDEKVWTLIQKLQ
jgi:hypothetical protein